VAQTFALIAPVLSVLQQVSCSYETIPNAPKYYETDWIISSGTNGADWVCFLRKNPDVTSCHELFALIAPLHLVLHRVSCSYEAIPNAPEHFEMHQNMSRVQWGGSGALVAKNYNVTSCHRLLHYLHQFNMFCTKFDAFTKHFQMLPNTT
jgi:hypothetical protein